MKYIIIFALVLTPSLKAQDSTGIHLKKSAGFHLLTDIGGALGAYCSIQAVKTQNQGLNGLSVLFTLGALACEGLSIYHLNEAGKKHK